MIKVIGNRPVMKKGDKEIGVVGDNKVKTLEFSIDRIQGGIDLSGYSAWGLIERSPINGGESYSTLVTKTTLSDKITISLPITSNETKDYGYIYASIKFAEDEESLPIWQTQRILLKIAKGINGETEAEALETNIFDAQVAAFQAAIDVLDLTNYEHTDNKITSISASSTDGEYPSGKAVWEKVQDFSSTSLNTYLGFASGLGSSSQYCVGVGAYALNSLTSGTSNTSVGTRSLRANTTGFQNTAIGSAALSDNVTGYDNVAVGAFALELSNSAIGCIGIGSYALTKTTKYWNTAVGHSSMRYNTSGYQNSGFGGYALEQCTTGVNNTGVGYYSLHANTTGVGNTALGAYSLRKAVGSYNTVVGSEAARFKTTSNNCVYIGYRCQALQDATRNEIVIGSGANGAGTNTVTLGDTSIVSTVLRGDVKIGTKITASNGTDPAVGITATAGDSSTKLATTAFVQGEISGKFATTEYVMGSRGSAAVKLVQDSYNILESDEIVFCDGWLNPMYTVVLPHSAVGKKYTIKSVDAEITINPYLDETIDGEDDITIDGGTAIEIVCYSSGKWAIISRYTP